MEILDIISCQKFEILKILKSFFWGQNEQNQITKFLEMASHEVLENIFFEKFNKKCKNSNLELINSQNS